MHEKKNVIMNIIMTMILWVTFEILNNKEGSKIMLMIRSETRSCCRVKEYILG